MAAASHASTVDDAVATGAGAVCASELLLQALLEADETDDELPSSSSSNATLAKTPNEKPKFASSQARQRHEKQTLAAQVEQLEAALRLMTRRLTGSSSCVDCSREDQVALLECQKSAVQRQREQRERLEQENRQLRARLRTQRRLARGLRRVLVGREAMNTIAQGKLLNSAPRVEMICNDDSAFRSMLADLAAMRSRVDDALLTIERACPTTGSFRQWEPRFNAHSAVSIEMVGCEEVPFAKRAVDRALHLHRHDKSRNFRRLDLKAAGGPPGVDATVEMTRIPHTVDVAAYRQRQLTCSLRSDEQTIAMTLAYIDSVDGSGRTVPGFRVKAQLWTVRGVYSLRWDRDSIQTAVIPTWDRQMATRIQQIENFLVESKETTLTTRHS